MNGGKSAWIEHKSFAFYYGSAKSSNMYYVEKAVK